MRALSIPLVVILALAACGGSTVSVGDPAADGGGSSSSSDGNGTGNACVGAQGPYCPWGDCLDGPRAACNRGVWVCPTPPSSCGEQCSAHPIPDCKCGTPTCHFGSWQCPGSCADAGADAARDADANATFPCGGLVCHVAAEYCKVGEGGPAGAQPSYVCEPIPAACAADVTCACIQPAAGGQLCSDTPGVTVTFEYP